MRSKILAVDKDTARYGARVAEWAEFGLESVRVDSMNKGIALLSKKDTWFFVTICEDSVPDFMELLSLMRDTTNIPILIETSSYTKEKKFQTICLGADIYDSFNEHAKENLFIAIELTKLQNRRMNRTVNDPPILALNDVILSPSRHSVFVGETKIMLAKKEFDILHQLMLSNGHVVTHACLLSKVWVDGNVDVLWRTVDRLRKKLYGVSFKDYINVVRGVGYVFNVYT